MFYIVVKCHQCNTNQDPGCGDSFWLNGGDAGSGFDFWTDNGADDRTRLRTTEFFKECPHDEHVYRSCLKIKTKYNNVEKVIRECSTVSYDGVFYCSGFIDVANNSMTTCNCSEDGCNDASSIKPLSLIGLLIAGLLTKKYI
jgi:hypothetical protein